MIIELGSIPLSNQKGGEMELLEKDKKGLFLDCKIFFWGGQVSVMLIASSFHGRGPPGMGHLIGVGPETFKLVVKIVSWRG